MQMDLAIPEMLRGWVRWALPLVLAAGSALPAAHVAHAQAFALSCSPSAAAQHASVAAHQVQVDCIVTLNDALAPGASVRADLGPSQVDQQTFVSCHSSTGIRCDTSPSASTFVCPAPEGCPAGSSFTFTILLSSNSSQEVLGQLSVAAGPAPEFMGASVSVTQSLDALLPGWHLVALPPGSVVAGAEGPLYALQPGASSYEVVQPGQPTTAGMGYWVYSPGSVVVSLGAGPATPAPYMPSFTAGGSIGDLFATSIYVPAGGWALVGNPTGNALAELDGADAAYTYDDVHGYQPLVPQGLRPGQAAMVYSAEGGVVSVTPAIP